MSIKGRIRAFQLVVVLTLTAMAAMALVNLRASNYELERVQYARQQLAAAAQLAILANRFSEQIAELLLIGEPERPDFDSARSQVGQALADLRLVTLREADAISGGTEKENVELDRIDRMLALFSEIDRAVERLLLLNQEGRRDQAVALFRSEIENRLDAEFERLIRATLSEEQDEVRSVEAEVAQRSRWVTVATLTGLAAVITATLVTGFFFARSIERPIKGLAEGTVAIERGDLDHRINPLGKDELGLLAKRFNAMAEQLERQHALLTDAQAELERQVAERTTELAEANRQLTEADQQRVRFLGDISHELRTPLTALRGEAEVALRGAPNQEVYGEALSTVVARAADIARLVEDLLVLARSEADEIRFDMRRVDPAEVIAAAVRDAAILARDRGVQVDISPEGASDPVLIRCDTRRLKQAVMITLDNAIKYSDPGTRVEVGIRVAPDDDGVAEITMRDQGAGLATEDIPRAFERFFRGANARERWDGGSGLGLSIARWIVEKHEGSLELSSALGQGTEVRFRLPIVR